MSLKNVASPLNSPSRIAAARWNSSNAPADKPSLTLSAPCQCQGVLVVSTNALRYWSKNWSISPPGPSSRAKSSTGTSALLPATNG